MNIFYLSKNAKECAKYHADKHTIKMILEYSQLLSTAHRVLDGKETLTKSSLNRSAKRWIFDDERDNILYSATHVNHPSAIWVRKSLLNYMWLSNLLIELCKEYTYRYGKVHKCESVGLVNYLLNNAPKNIPLGEFTEPTPAMPDSVKVFNFCHEKRISCVNSLSSYRNYYMKEKRHIASWVGKLNSREIPSWYS